jgi:hypothetical protein
MQHDRLHASSRLAEADWLAARLRPFGSGVASLVPGGFPAYVRILHPANGPGDAMRTWADVAASSGRLMHSLAQFHAISRPETGASIGAVDPPRIGNLEPNRLMSLCEVLRQHTKAPQTCWFCVWDGYGWLHEKQHSGIVFTNANQPSASSAHTPADALPSAVRAAVVSDIRLHLPYREYLFLEGPLEAAMEIGWRLAGERFIPQSPNLFWPSDHAWCVASEIDLLCTLVAGSNELAEDLLAEPRLETWRVFADDPVHADSDEINQ